ncbi:MAG TPA: A24 family peptidase [Vicinamibacterales bacterium]|nr:A24 family peptidase [Vicinamibacterales bacterium]
MPPAAAIAAVAVLGLAVGSFLNVCIHRLPKKLSIVWPASRCPSCERPLAWFENVPLLSYAALGGRCRTCRAPISIRYPMVEAITASVFVLQYLAVGPTPLLAARLVFMSALIVLFAIDLEHQLLPNAITLPGIVCGLAFALVLPPGLIDALLGAVLGGGILFAIAEGYYRIRGEDGMGMGDVKMLAMIGAFLGWKLMLLTLILGSFAGSFVGMLILATRRGTMRAALPFGTFLAIGAAIASLVGDRVIAWYVGLYM